MDDSKVDLIIEAARKRFSHFGVSKTTMTEIGNDLGLSKAALYYYFTDKDKLFMAVIRKDMDEFESAVNSLLQRSSKAAFKLKRYVLIRNEFFRKMLMLAKLEKTNVSEVVNSLHNEFRLTMMEREIRMVSQILRDGVKNKEFARFPVDEYADLFITGMIGLRTTRFAIGLIKGQVSQPDLDKNAILFTELFLKSIRSSNN